MTFGATRERLLATPAATRLAPEGVFDAFGWCESDELAWRRPANRWDMTTPIDGSDPARMVFVFHRHASESLRGELPRELARLHAFGLGLGDDEALAPWAIDAATDQLHARGARPRDLFWLAADNLNALFWGLHDWVHFHNHGPFVERAWTELQCDATALAWLWINRAELPLDGPTWERTRAAVESLAGERFAAEGLRFDPGVFDPERIRSLTDPLV
ncbi:MAG: hypothetical protein M3O50_02850 [Myxococcota bacterium]|nr:hypothetical protein [Myxococcota bacterium]